MSDLVMFPGKEEFKLRHTVEDTQPSSELTISYRTFLKNSNSAVENFVNVLFHRGRKTNKLKYTQYIHRQCELHQGQVFSNILLSYLFFEVLPLASDALLTTLHPLLENVLQIVSCKLQEDSRASGFDLLI
jgi:hypothetical protein